MQTHTLRHRSRKIPQLAEPGTRRAPPGTRVGLLQPPRAPAASAVRGRSKRSPGGPAAAQNRRAARAAGSIEPAGLRPPRPVRLGNPVRRPAAERNFIPQLACAAQPPRGGGGRVCAGGACPRQSGLGRAGARARARPGARPAEQRDGGPGPEGRAEGPWAGTRPPAAQCQCAPAGGAAGSTRRGCDHDAMFFSID